MHQRSRISTIDDTFDEFNHYTTSSRQQSESIPSIDHNEVYK